MLKRWVDFATFCIVLFDKCSLADFNCVFNRDFLFFKLELDVVPARVKMMILDVSVAFKRSAFQANFNGVFFKVPFSFPSPSQVGLGGIQKPRGQNEVGGW